MLLTRLRRTAAVLAATTVTTVALCVPAHVADAASTASTAAAATSGGRYLALGDSVPFGYREPANLPTPDYPDAASFVGYPEDVAAELGLTVANASCPGETSASLIDENAPSNGCETEPDGSPGYRERYPLHVAYPHSQLSFATSYLRRHRDTRLVTLMIGANDGFLCQRATPDGCASELPALLATIGRNVTRTLKQVRTTGGYTGQIVIVNYYSLDYRSATTDAFSQALNAAVDSAGAPYGAAVADGYGAFQRAAAQAGGDTCAAGLLTTLTTGGCGIHPSVAGQELLAGAVERAVSGS